MKQRGTSRVVGATWSGTIGAAVVAAGVLVGTAAAAAGGLDWGDVTTPTPGPAHVIGGYAGGCLTGAVELPPEGTGYQAVDLGRQRHFGHPKTIAYIQDLGRRAAEEGLGKLLIGDVAQPRGGPMRWGHISHQVGLDVDIWYRLDLPPLPRHAREGIEQPSVLDPATGYPDPQLWTADHAELIRLAADDERVARIFVDPAIKRDLCAREWPDRDWLRLIRPWPHHDDHLHVRLHCPPDTPECTPQTPLPAGDGCGAELDVWFDPQPPGVATMPSRTLPFACRAVLTGASGG